VGGEGEIYIYAQDENANAQRVILAGRIGVLIPAPFMLWLVAQVTPSPLSARALKRPIY